MEMTRGREDDGQGCGAVIKWWPWRSQEALLNLWRDFRHKIQKTNRHNGWPTYYWIYYWNYLLHKLPVSFPSQGIALCIYARYFKNFTEASGLKLASGEGRDMVGRHLDISYARLITSLWHQRWVFSNSHSSSWKTFSFNLDVSNLEFSCLSHQRNNFL